MIQSDKIDYKITFLKCSTHKSSDHRTPAPQMADQLPCDRTFGDMLYVKM